MNEEIITGQEEVPLFTQMRMEEDQGDLRMCLLSVRRGLKLWDHVQESLFFQWIMSQSLPTLRIKVTGDKVWKERETYTLVIKVHKNFWAQIWVWPRKFLWVFPKQFVKNSNEFFDQHNSYLNNYWFFHIMTVFLWWLLVTVNV